MPSKITRDLKKLTGLASFVLLICLFFFFPGNTGFSLKEPRVEEINLGIVKSGSIINRSLEFTEEIKDPIPDCECVKVKLAKKAQSSPETGDSVYILKIAFFAEGSSGPLEQTIRLKDKDNNPMLIRLKAVIEKT
jgi:hypothetical protein